MSILKRFLTEDLKALLRRGTAEDPEGRAAKLGGIAPRLDPFRPDRKEQTSEPGMKVVLLNWKLGDNDPFTVVNATMQGHFRACGKDAVIIEISDENWPARLHRAVAERS